MAEDGELEDGELEEGELEMEPVFSDAAAGAAGVDARGGDSGGGVFGGGGTGGGGFAGFGGGGGGGGEGGRGVKRGRSWSWERGEGGGADDPWDAEEEGQAGWRNGTASGGGGGGGGRIDQRHEHHNSVPVHPQPMGGGHGTGAHWAPPPLTGHPAGPRPPPGGPPMPPPVSHYMGPLAGWAGGMSYQIDGTVGLTTGGFAGEGGGGNGNGSGGGGGGVGGPLPGWGADGGGSGGGRGSGGGGGRGAHTTWPDSGSAGGGTDGRDGSKRQRTGRTTWQETVATKPCLFWRQGACKNGRALLLLPSSAQLEHLQGTELGQLLVVTGTKRLKLS